MIYIFQKQVNTDKLNKELQILAGYSHLETEGGELRCYFSAELDQSTLNQLNLLVTNHNPVDMVAYIQSVLRDAMNFGNQLIAEFAAENVLMGITQDGMTGVVRKNMSEVISALSTGSLYDAIQEAKVIPADKKDNKYITNARLTIFVNKIEAYLQIPLTTVT